MANLVISGDSSGSITLAAPAVSGTTVLTLPTTTGTLVVTGGAQTIEFADGSAAAPSITNSGDTNTGMFFPAADTIAFSEGGVEAMRINSSANVGIGTTTPATKLVVKGTHVGGEGLINIIADSGTQFAALSFTNNVTQKGIVFHDNTNNLFYLYGAAGQGLAFNSNDAERMRITSAGDVGIGTSSPVGKLNVIGGLGVGASLTGDNAITPAANGGIIISGGNQASLSTYSAVGNATTVGALNYYAAIDQSFARFFDIVGYGSTSGAGANIRFLTGSATSVERMRIDSAGNVGIGTSSPNARLNVVGGGTAALIVAGGSGSTIRNTASAGSSWYVGTNVDSYILHNESNTPMLFTTNGTERMRITSGGSLLVGTTANVGRFGVSGGDIAKVTTSGFDGVFDNIIKYGTASDLASGTALANRFIGIDGTITAGAAAANVLRIRAYPGGSGNAPPINVADFRGDGSVQVYGALSKGSGSFKIDHPLTEKTETHHLVHSFIEGPQADLIYRGVVALVAGKATVNIDEAADMTEGTFEALCRDVQCFTTNESDWTAVRGKVVGNVLTIEAQDLTATSKISWMVIGERKDKHMYDTEWTDKNGKVIVEPSKENLETK